MWWQQQQLLLQLLLLLLLLLLQVLQLPLLLCWHCFWYSHTTTSHISATAITSTTTAATITATNGTIRTTATTTATTCTTTTVTTNKISKMTDTIVVGYALSSGEMHKGSDTCAAQMTTLALYMQINSLMCRHTTVGGVLLPVEGRALKTTEPSLWNRSWFFRHCEVVVVPTANHEGEYLHISVPPRLPTSYKCSRNKYIILKLKTNTGDPLP